MHNSVIITRFSNVISTNQIRHVVLCWCNERCDVSIQISRQFNLVPMERTLGTRWLPAIRATRNVAQGQIGPS